VGSFLVEVRIKGGSSEKATQVFESSSCPPTCQGEGWGKEPSPQERGGESLSVEREDPSRSGKRTKEDGTLGVVERRHFFEWGE